VYNRRTQVSLVTLLFKLFEWHQIQVKKDNDMTSASSSTAQVTQLLVAWSEGNQSALETLTPLVHEELRRLAHHYMKGERARTHPANNGIGK